MKNYYLFLFSFFFLTGNLFGQTTTCITFTYDNSGNRVQRFTDYECDGTPFLETKDTVQLADDVFILNDQDNAGSGNGIDESTANAKEETDALDNTMFANNFDVIRVYPNPARNNLYIRQSLSEQLRAKIFYVDGRVVKDNLILSDFNEINVADFIRGIYIVEIYPEGDSPVRFKFEKL